MMEVNEVEIHIIELTKKAKELIDGQMGNGVEEGGNKGKFDFP